LIATAQAAGQNAAPAPAKQSVNNLTASPCLFNPERGEIPNCLYEKPSGETFVAPQFLRELSFDSHGLAPVSSPKEGWMYVNRQGKVIIRGVPIMDNGPDSFHNGLVRVVRGGKYGFANRAGQLVVPATYDGARNFENGLAAVCTACENRCVEPECEHHSFVGGEWFHINTKGTVVARIHRDN
jgi:hypothetical protein